MMQRIGRANHRLDEPSKAYLVPVEPLRDARMPGRARRGGGSRAGHAGAAHRGARRAGAARPGRRLRRAPFDADLLYEEVRGAAPYAALTRARIRRGDRFRGDGRLRAADLRSLRKIRQGPDGLWRVTNGRIAQQYRMNVGTIVEAAMVKVRLGRRAAEPRRRRRRHRGRARARRDRGVLRRDHGGRRHVRVRGRGPALRGHASATRRLVTRARGHRPDGPVL